MPINLWPEVFGKVEQKTPVGILREQARGLGDRTANIVVGRVHTTPGSAGKFRHVMSLYCAPLAYQTSFLYADHDLGLYPVDIFVEGEDGPPIHANNAEEFTARLKEIFSRESTKKIISSLLAQSEQ